jgi:hypothetical protein
MLWYCCWLLAAAPGMYLGSAAAMLVLPSVAVTFGAASLLRLVGCLGLAWLAMWLVVGREIPHRWDLSVSRVRADCEKITCEMACHALL